MRTCCGGLESFTRRPTKHFISITIRSQSPVFRARSFLCADVWQGELHAQLASVESCEAQESARF